GVLQVRQVRMPRIHGNGAELDRVEQCEKVATDVTRLFLSAIRYNLFDAHFGRRIFRGFLLVEALAVDAVGKSLEDERTVLDRRQDKVSDAHVVTHDVALRVLLLGEEHLIEIRDFQNLAAAEVEASTTAGLFDLAELGEQ